MILILNFLCKRDDKKDLWKLTSEGVGAWSVWIANIQFAFVDINALIAKWFVARSTFTFICSNKVVTFGINWTIVSKISFTFIDISAFSITVRFVSGQALAFITATKVFAFGSLTTWIRFAFVRIDTNSSVSCVVASYYMMNRLESD